MASVMAEEATEELGVRGKFLLSLISPDQDNQNANTTGSLQIRNRLSFVSWTAVR